MNLRSSLVTFGCVTTIALIAACTDDATDGTRLEPSRDDRINKLADEACDRYEDTDDGCPGYGTGENQKYANETDCENDFRNAAVRLWPADRCDGGRIDNGRFETCLDRVEQYACSTGGQNFLDGISALNECSADQVCVDSAN